jgi:hypothetical protein
MIPPDSLQQTIQPDGILHCFGTVSIGIAAIGRFRSIRSGDQMDDRRIALNMLCARRFGKGKELVLRPAAIEPIRQRIETPAMTKDDARFVRLECVRHAIFQRPLQGHHHALKKFLARRNANGPHQENCLGQHRQTLTPRWFLQQFFNERGFAAAGSAGEDDDRMIVHSGNALGALSL